MIHTECFMSGDPYKGAERTAGVRATQVYYSAWTGTVRMKCWHFGGINLVYATKTKAPHWAKRLLDIRGAHNWHSYNRGGGGGGEQNSCVKRQFRYSNIMYLWEMKYMFTCNHTTALNRVWQYWHRWRKCTHTHTKFDIYTQKPISISFHSKVPWKYGCHDNTTHGNWQYPVSGLVVEEIEI